MVSDTDGPISFPDGPKLELDELIERLIENAQAVRRTQGRLRALLRAIETVTGDLALESVLRSIVSAACELANAKYGALGVIGADRAHLEQFVYVGLDEQTAAEIGELPRGRGLLGALITDPRPIRLQHRTDDPRSTPFPPHHPPMDSFLGVPVMARGEVFGNLYLTDSTNGEFSAEDEELVLALASAAGTAVTNARTYQEAQLQQRWLEASVEIGTQMLSTEGEDPLRLIARRAIELAEADAVSVSLLTDDKNLAVEVAFGENAEELVGRRFAIGDTIGGEVVQSGAPTLLTDATAEQSRRTHHASVMDAGPVMVLPMEGTSGTRGVLTLLRARGRRSFTPNDLAMAAGFAAQASVALELADSRAAEQKVALLEDRDRIARDLHDHVIQELFSIGLGLQGVAARQTEEKLADRVRRSIDGIDRTIRRIRTSVFELRGNFVTTEGGLRQSILEVVSDSATALGFVPHVAFAGVIDQAIDDDLADDVLACVRETLTNVAKHARASDAFVDIVATGNELTVTVSDNGVGLRDATRSSGIGNLRARAERRGGAFDLAPGPTGGTVATWKVQTA